jgi:chromosomal replication initiation ATPase DnaA
MDIFTAALDVLTDRGYCNALELANEIEQASKVKESGFEADKKRLFEIMREHFPTYCVGRKAIQRNLEIESYIESRMPMIMEAVNSKSRIQDLVKVRQIMMYLLRKSGYTLEEVGFSFGGRDHSTAIHAIQTVGDLCEVDKAYKAKFEEIKKAYLS